MHRHREVEGKESKVNENKIVVIKKAQVKGKPIKVTLGIEVSGS